MADLLPGISSNDEEDNDHSSDSDDDDDAAMSESFQYGGILGEDGLYNRTTPTGWSLSNQILQQATTAVLPRTKVSDLISAKRKELKQKKTTKETTTKDCNSNQGSDDNDDDGDSHSVTSSASSSSTEESLDKEDGDMEMDTLKIRAGKEDEEVEMGGEGNSLDNDDNNDEAKAEAYFEETVEGRPADTDAVTSFAELGLSRPLLKGVAAMGFVVPTPIQASVIPIALAGRDVCASAQTGSGYVVVQ